MRVRNNTRCCNLFPVTREMLSHLMPLVRPGRRHKRRKSENLPELDVFIVLGNKVDKKEKIIAIVFINSNIYEATDVRDVCCRVAFIMFMKK